MLMDQLVNRKLEITVNNKSMLFNETIGSCKIDLSSIGRTLEEKEILEWYDLI
jgi:hypothetical protein